MDLDLSNTDKSIKYLKKIMIPYVENKRKDNNGINQAGFLISDIFRGHKTKPAIIFIIFGNFLMFIKFCFHHKWNDAPYNHGIYGLAHMLLNDLRLRILGN